MAANILVAVMTAAAVTWLIWAEMNSRRNMAKQNAAEPVEDVEVNPQPSRRKASTRR